MLLRAGIGKAGRSALRRSSPGRLLAVVFLTLLLFAAAWGVQNENGARLVSTGTQAGRNGTAVNGRQERVIVCVTQQPISAGANSHAVRVVVQSQSLIRGTGVSVASNGWIFYQH